MSAYQPLNSSAFEADGSRSLLEAGRLDMGQRATPRALNGFRAIPVFDLGGAFDLPGASDQFDLPKDHLAAIRGALDGVNCHA